MSKLEDIVVVKVRPRRSESLTIRLPSEVIFSLRRVAKLRDMDLEALIRLYIGMGLREDLASQASDFKVAVNDNP